MTEMKKMKRRGRAKFRVDVECTANPDRRLSQGLVKFETRRLVPRLSEP